MQLSPVSLSVNVRQVSAGMVHSEALDSSGNVWTFGDNTYGQLGLGSKVLKSTNKPTQMFSLKNIKQLATGHHSAAIDAKGALYFWGTGVFGVFYEPRLIVEDGVVDVSVGGTFGCLKDKLGMVWVWGKSDALGFAKEDKLVYPKPLASLKRKEIQKVICGGDFAVALGPLKPIASPKSITSIVKTEDENSKPVFDFHDPKVPHQKSSSILNISVPDRNFSHLHRTNSAKPKKKKKAPQQPQQPADSKSQKGQLSNRGSGNPLTARVMQLEILLQAREAKIQFLLAELDKKDKVCRELRLRNELLQKEVDLSRRPIGSGSGVKLIRRNCK